MIIFDLGFEGMEPIAIERYAHIVFYTGAGMSVESSVPTYRGRGGIWSRYRWEAFAADPGRGWRGSARPLPVTA